MANSKEKLTTRSIQSVARYLERIGYEVLEANYECEYGSADLIALDGETLVFLEVEVSTSITEGFAHEAPDFEKIARWERVACQYFAEHGELVNHPVRFDVICLVVCGDDRAMVKHYINEVTQPIAERETEVSENPESLDEKYAITSEENDFYRQLARKRAYWDLKAILERSDRDDEITLTDEQMEKILEEYTRRRYSDWAIQDEDEDMRNAVQHVTGLAL